MELFYAKHHVRRSNSMIRPGEVFEDSAEDPRIQRLLKIGAIARCSLEESEKPQQPEEAAAAAAPEECPAVEEAAEEPAEEAALPEIDVMDGISAAPAAPVKKTRSRKSGGKQQ